MRKVERTKRSVVSVIILRARVRGGAFFGSRRVDSSSSPPPAGSAAKAAFGTCLSVLGLFWVVGPKVAYFASLR